MIFPKLIFKIEKWKFNSDYGVYVSTLGHFKDRYKRNLPIKINQGGYCAIKTEKGIVAAHRLVLFTWRPIPNAEQLTVDHKNHNKRDNSLENLEWMTAAENRFRAAEDLVNAEDVSPAKQYYYYIGKNKFTTIDDAYDFLKSKKASQDVQKYRLNKILTGLATERERGNFAGSVKSYFGYNITAVERTK